MALTTTLYVLPLGTGVRCGRIRRPTTSFAVLEVRRVHELEHATVDGKEGAASAPLRSQLIVSPFGVGPDVGGYGRRIRRAVFIDLGVAHRQSLRQQRLCRSASFTVILGHLVDVGDDDVHVDLGVLACVAAHDLDLNGDAEPLPSHGVLEVQLRGGAETQ